MSECKERFEVITESTMTNLNTSYSNEKKYQDLWIETIEK